jgi:hypothetical protein
MNKQTDKEDEEPLAFWGGWRGLYIFLIVYGALQVVLLYIFTQSLNKP